MRLSTQSSDLTIDNRRIYIRTQIRHCEDIPAVPSAVKAISALLNDINCPLDDLEAAIVSDPACAARMLQVANSAFYGSQRAIISVRRAILLLGFNALSDLVNNMPVFDSFNRREASEIASINNLYLHSLAVARLSQRIANDACQQNVDAEAAFYAGLLHDIGRVVLFYLFPEDYHQLLAQMEDNSQFDLSKAELETFEVTHAEAGRWFAEVCHLPAPIFNVIAFHHHLRIDNSLVMIVKLANLIVERAHIGLVDGHERETSPRPLLRGLNLSQDQFKQYSRYIHAEVDDLQRAVSHAA